MSDEEIDTSDVPVISNFINPAVGKFSDIEFRGYDVRSIANWCIRQARAEGIKTSRLWLNKIVSLIYQESLTSNLALLTPARMEAWDFGPVFREIYYSYPDGEYDLFYRFNVSRRCREVAMDPFASKDLDLFKKVWMKFGHLSGSRLTTITHAPDTPWSKVWSSGRSVNPGMQIGVSVILGHEDGQGDDR